MITDIENERVKFEEWAKASGQFTDWTKDFKTGEYIRPRVRLAWESWKASLANRNR